VIHAQISMISLIHAPEHSLWLISKEVSNRNGKKMNQPTELMIILS